MKTRCLILLSMVLLSYAGWVFGSEANSPTRYEAKLDAYGFFFHTLISDAQLKEAPLWSDTALNPPLEPGIAMLVATEFIKNSIASSKPWAVESILLKYLSDGHWIYAVQFNYTGPPHIRAGYWLWWKSTS